jgi:hypothetical protein
MKRATLLFGFVVAAMAMAQETAYDLAWKTADGDTAEYTFNAELVIGDQKFTVIGNNRDKTVSVAKDGSYTVESTQYGVTFKSEDGDQDLPDSEIAKLSMSADRLILKHNDNDEADFISIRLGNLNTVRKPVKAVKVGDKWSADIPSIVKGIPAVKADYEVLALEKVGSWESLKIKIASREVDSEEKATSTGTVWIDVISGRPTKEVFNMKNVPFTMSPVPININYSSERKK